MSWKSATYHGNLWLTNLAIEGEGDDPVIATEFPALIGEYMKRAVYPDGSALEDGYVANLALREGSNALVAAEKRGYGHLTSQKFRNLVYHTALMYEPWACGDYVGGSSGGGNLFPAFHALVRSTYPDGPLPRMLWRQRMGDDFKGDGKCRAVYTQTNAQLFHLGLSHEADTPDSPGSLLPPHHYAPIRGMVIGRSDPSSNGLYTHFDARGDCFLLGHGKNHVRTRGFRVLMREYSATTGDASPPSNTPPDPPVSILPCLQTPCFFLVGALQTMLTAERSRSVPTGAN